MLILTLRNGGVSVALILLLALLLQRKRRVRIQHIVGLCLFTLYLSAVFAVTGVTPMSGGFSFAIDAEKLSLTPFVGMAEIIRTSVQNRDFQYAAFNLLGNVLLFVPLGFFVPLLWKRYRKLWKTALFALALSLVIELTQLFLSRGSDVDDLILNTLGGVAGYGLFKLLRRFAKKLTKRSMLGKAQRESLWRFFPYACVLVALIVSIALGAADRRAYGLDGPAQAAAVMQEALPEERGDAEPAPEQTPQPPEAELSGDPVGTLTLSDGDAMTLMSQLTVPPVTAEPSDEDRAALVKLFSGHTLIGDSPACDSDLIVQSGSATLVVHTECGSVTASLPELSGATTLTGSELAALGEILSHYGIALSGAELPEDVQPATDAS